MFISLDLLACKTILFLWKP